MGAPTVTARTTPPNPHIDEGYPIQHAFASAPGLGLWEKASKIPGLSMGEPIPNWTMHNKNWMTKRMRHLKEMKPFTFKFAYNIKDIDAILAQFGKEQSITTHLPGFDTWSYFGALSELEFDELEAGKQPEGTATITPTNWDPAANTEADPVYTAANGTAGMVFP